MIVTGHISADREIVLPVTVLSGGPPVTVHAVLDTGFSGYLTLPAPQITSLSLLSVGAQMVVLGDGSTKSIRRYRASVSWAGVERAISVIEAPGVPLIGMALMYGYDVHMHVVDGGRAVIVRLP